ncbi:MAG: peptidoglycan-associated lipoprotein Pal [Ostreibacterium sp.]
MKYLLIMLITTTLFGCSTGLNKVTPTTTLGTSEDASSAGINGVYYGGEGYKPGASSGYNTASNGNFYDNPNYGQGVVGGPGAPAKDRIIYFSYDSSTIDSRAQAIVNAHANYLKQNPTKKVLLEGHTDSRGSREYNIALGERRAISVLKRFQALGVPITQIRLISYGEENPAVAGYNEDAYKRNRRVVIQY